MDVGAGRWSRSSRARRPAVGASTRRGRHADCSTRSTSGAWSSRVRAQLAAGRDLDQTHPSPCSTERHDGSRRRARRPAAHRQADSRLHLAIAAASGVAPGDRAVTQVQADLHEMLTAIPVLPTNIEHSDAQHARIVEAILARNAARARRGMERPLRRHGRAAARAAGMRETRKTEHAQRQAPPEQSSSCRHGSTPGRSTPWWSRSPTCRGGCRASGCTARYFRDEVLGHGTEGCNYLLGVDIDMNTVDGYAITSWDQGYGDMEFVLDPDTIRVLPHLPATAMVQCDLAWPDGRPVVQSPRAILQAQVDKAAEHGLRGAGRHGARVHRLRGHLRVGLRANYRGLTPANQYNVDYSILGTSRVEPLLRDIRNSTYAAGMNVEGAKGECNFGQHEIGFLYDDVVVTADNHAVYKTMAKEIAAQHGKSLTFMAKYDEREGNSCHIHLSLRGTDGEVVFWDDGGRAVAALRPVRRRGARHDAPTSPCSSRRTSTPTSGSPPAPSRRPRSPGARTTAPAPYAWSATARRADGEPRARGRRQPLPRARGDAGRRAARHRGGSCALEPTRWSATPTPPTSRRCRTLLDGTRRLPAAPRRPGAVGDEVVDHYTNMADVELAAVRCRRDRLGAAARLRADVSSRRPATM